MITTYKWGRPFDHSDETSTEVFLHKGAVSVMCLFEGENPSIKIEGASFEMVEDEGEGIEGVNFMFDFSVTEGAVSITHSGKEARITWKRARTFITLTDWNDREVTLRVKPDGLHFSYEKLSKEEKEFQNCEMKLKNEIELAPQDSKLQEALREMLFTVQMSSDPDNI